jgi:hypothetical protein
MKHCLCVKKGNTIYKRGELCPIHNKSNYEKFIREAEAKAQVFDGMVEMFGDDASFLDDDMGAK